jgi:hypothetical protein
MELHRDLMFQHIFNTVSTLSGRNVTHMDIETGTCRRTVSGDWTPRDLHLRPGYVYKAQVHTSLCKRMCRKVLSRLRRLLKALRKPLKIPYE